MCIPPVQHGMGPAGVAPPWPLASAVVTSSVWARLGEPLETWLAPRHALDLQDPVSLVNEKGGGLHSTGGHT